MPKTSKKVVEPQPEAMDDDSDFANQDDAPVVPQKKAKVDESVSISSAPSAPSTAPTPSSTLPSASKKSTALVKAASTSLVAQCNVNESKKRMDKLFGGKSKMQAEANPMGNTKKNYALVRGVVLAIGETTHESKKVVDGKSQANKFTKYLLCIAAQEVKVGSPVSLVYGGNSDDPSCNFAVPNKVVTNPNRKDMEPDFRHAPELPRLVNLSLQEFSIEKKNETEKNAWYSTVKPGCIVQATLEIKLKKGAPVFDGYVDMHATKIELRAPVDMSAYNPTAATLQKLFYDPSINATAHDTMIDVCGGINAFRYGTSADEVEYLNPKILTLEDEECMEKRASIMKPENYDQLATLEYNARVEKRKATVAKELKRMTSIFPEGTDASAKEAYEARANELLRDEEPKQLHELLQLTDKDVQGLYVMCSNNMRTNQLFEEGCKLPKRWCEAILQHMEVASNKSFVAMQFSFVLCSNSAEVAKHLKNDVDGTLLMRSQKSVENDAMQSRLTVKIDMSRMANVFAIRSLDHVSTAVNVLMQQAQFCIKTSIKNPMPISNGMGALEDRYAEAFIIDVPGALKCIGIPVSAEWVKTNLCKGKDSYPGLKHVERMTEGETIELVGDYKSKGKVVTEITERGFMNLTEYKGDIEGDDNPHYNAPMDNPIRMVVVLDDPKVAPWYEQIREAENLGQYDMASNGQGEAFLDQLFFQQNKDAKKEDDMKSLNEFLVKHNAIVYSLLEGKTSNASAMQLN